VPPVIDGLLPPQLCSAIVRSMAGDTGSIVASGVADLMRGFSGKPHLLSVTIYDELTGFYPTREQSNRNLRSLALPARDVRLMTDDNWYYFLPFVAVIVTNAAALSAVPSLTTSFTT
jgi:hypothetical protein